MLAAAAPGGLAACSARLLVAHVACEGRVQRKQVAMKRVRQRAAWEQGVSGGGGGGGSGGGRRTARGKEPARSLPSCGSPGCN